MQLTDTQRALLSRALSPSADGIGVTPRQRLAIHEICADSGELVREPDEFLVAFKKCLDDAANDARVAGPERSTLLARLVIVFMQELYGMERRETVREDSACRGKSLPGVGHYQH